jgi:hypothetical protein
MRLQYSLHRREIKMDIGISLNEDKVAGEKDQA